MPPTGLPRRIGLSSRLGLIGDIRMLRSGSRQIMIRPTRPAEACTREGTCLG